MTEPADLPATFTTTVARSCGVHPRDLYTWRDTGIVIEMSRGVFRRADAPLAPYPDALAVAHRSSRAIVCCVSAAVVHELTDEMPAATQIAVPKRSHAPRIVYPPVTVFRFEERTFAVGLSAFEAAPREWVRVYDAARTVVDLMRFRRRLGAPLAHAAIHRYLASCGRPALLLEYAQALGSLGPIRAALDVASAR